MSPYTAKEIVSQFKIGDPIGSLFQPKFYFEFDRQYAKFILRLKCRAPDADGVKGVIDVNLQREFPQECFDEYNLIKQLRHMLADLLLHELDESICYLGQKIFDPHKNEKQ